MKDIVMLLMVAVIAPLAYPLMASERIFLGYIVTSFLPVIFFTLRANNWHFNFETLREACFPKNLWKHQSTKVDWQYFLINTALFTTLIVPFIGLAMIAVDYTHHGLQQVMGVNQHPWPVTPIAVIAVTLFIAICSDFAVFFAHYLQHKIPFLWEFHKVHHSAAVLTPITVYRMHPVDDLLTISLGGILMGSAMGLMQYIFGMQPSLMQVAGLNVFTFIFYMAFYNLRHSQFWLHYPGILGVIFISPAMHQIHHSSHQRHWDKNFGFMFGIWDRAFGTLYNRKEKEDLLMGIGEETAEYDSVAAPYFLPFKKNWRRWKKRLGFRDASTLSHPSSHL